ncbi:hypothetical protein HNR60_000552 [Rhodopseudomonas rhenobacensis]|uniref:Uncharacterized protein n=1 Tax=Rhodopseudomonas rhenobacensis TaxID=87461 RepID=A0A7W7Z0R8_9BRAD|nr:hypothetical protein [Rhodopseudomonas rhenobacensis]MBB5045817.1 hypothetical protein [Rhodopseudomonas rhenobacensis]
MRRLIPFTVGVVVVLGSAAAFAQTGTGTGSGMTTPGTPSVAPSQSSEQRAVGTAPVGHRQPRLDPSLPDPSARDPADVALDRQLRSICRGC